MRKGKRKSTSRRSFLGNFGAIAAASGAASSALSARPASSPAIPSPRTTRKLRIGVVGGGFGANFHWHEHPESSLVAVAELDEKRRHRLQRVYKAPKAYVDFKELVADRDVEAVAVFTGVPAHFWMSDYAMRHGKHVVCAVPAAIHLEECEKLIETVKSTGMTYMSAETSYYYPGIISCRRWQKEGKFGQIFYSEGEYLHDVEDFRGVAKFFQDGEGNRTWRWGMPPMFYITHSTAGIISVTGERLTDVACVGHGHDHPALRENPYGSNPFSNSVAFFKTSGGHAARVSEFRHYGGSSVVRNEFYGTRMSYLDASMGGGNARIGMTPHKTEEWEQESHSELLPPELRKETGHAGSHPHLTHEFVRSILEERWPALDVYESVAYCAPGLVAQESALRDGEWLRIPDFGKAPVR